MSTNVYTESKHRDRVWGRKKKEKNENLFGNEVERKKERKRDRERVKKSQTIMVNAVCTLSTFVFHVCKQT